MKYLAGKRGGNDSFTMGEGKTVQADKPESPKTWENPSNVPKLSPVCTEGSQASFILSSFFFFPPTEPEKKKNFFLIMRRNPRSPNGPTLSLVRRKHFSLIKKDNGLLGFSYSKA